DVFGLIRGALPRLGKLALLHDPRAFAWRGRPLPEVGQRPPSRLERVRQAAARLGIELMEVSIAAPGEAYAAARKALTSADALFISVDAVVVLGSTGALRAAMEARKPAFGGLESLVRQGALGAVVPSPARLGTVGARVAHAALLGASLAATVAPEASEIAINQRAADVLGVRLPARLLERAVRVYEAIEEPSSANA
ncbi:MAG: hypothetical protein KC620_19570, partial [Myxococcales bacterium]|nr:hypothetical protein [Myxococcales bacterium]